MATLALVGGCAPGAVPARDGCSGPGIVLAFSAGSSEPAPAVPRELREAVGEQARRGAVVCVAVVGPRGQVREVDVTARRRNGEVENGPARDRLVEENLATLDRAVSGVEVATGSGLDPLGVIDVATRLRPGPGLLYVVTSGIATEPPTDLRQLGWDLDAVDQAARLKAAGDVPDLRGRRVRFAGIGDVAGRQPAPGIALRGRLRAWWLAICRAGGAADCGVDGELLPGRSPASRNPVPVVPLPRPLVGNEGVTLPNALLFPIGSATLTTGADAELRKVVDGVGERRVRIEGHTDAVTGTPVTNRQLSEKRAEAVAARLVELGLTRNQIVQVGGVGADGADAGLEHADPGQVARDRNVRITVQEEGARP